MFRLLFQATDFGSGCSSRKLISVAVKEGGGVLENGLVRGGVESQERRVRHLPAVDVRLPGKGSSNSHGARPVHLIITMIKWIRTSRLSIKNSLSQRAQGFGLSTWSRRVPTTRYGFCGSHMRLESGDDTFPAEGAQSPARTRKRDVLPQPFGPVTSTDSPGSTCWGLMCRVSGSTSQKFAAVPRRDRI